MPLHTAVCGGMPKITQMLLDAAQAAGINVVVENGSGDTLLEIAMQQYLNFKIQSDSEMGGMSYVPVLKRANSTRVKLPIQADVKELGLQLGRLRHTMGALASVNCLPADGKMAIAMGNFVQRMESKLQQAKERATVNAFKQEKETGDVVLQPSNTTDHAATLRLVKAVFTHRPATRKLVHLMDVQSVVRKKLEDQKRRQETRQEEKELGLDFDRSGDKESRDLSQAMSVLQRWTQFKFPQEDTFY